MTVLFLKQRLIKYIFGCVSIVTYTILFIMTVEGLYKVSDVKAIYLTIELIFYYTLPYVIIYCLFCILYLCSAKN